MMAANSRYLGRSLGESPHLACQPYDSRRADNHPEAGLPPRERELDADFLRVVNEETMERRKDQHHEQEQAVEPVIQRQQVAVLDLVEHQKPVVLPDHVIVGPDADQQREQPFLPGQHHQRAQRKENQQAAVQQVPVAGARLGVEIGAARRGEDVCTVEADAPEPPEQRNLDVQCGVEQQVNVTGEHTADHETEVYTAIDNPAGRRRPLGLWRRRPW